MRRCTRSTALPGSSVLGGRGSAIYRTDDGGGEWRKLEGLPTGNVGRIGLDIQQRNPNVLTVIVENLNARKEGMPARIDACQASGARGGGAAGGGRAGRVGGPMGNEVYRSEDGGRAWKKLHGDGIDVAGSKAPYSFNQIRTNPADPSQIVVTSDTMYESRDGGKTVDLRLLQRRVRRFPGDLVGRAGPAAHHARQRRRRERVLRRRPHRRLLPEQAARRGVCGGRRHGRSRTTSMVASRTTNRGRARAIPGAA